MKKFGEFVVSAFVAGLLVVVPLYVTILLLLKAMQSVVAFVRPFVMLLPEWLPAERILSLLVVLIICFLIGVAVRTPAGKAIRERIEKSFFERMPGYALFRSLTQRLAGKDEESAWKPALRGRAEAGRDQASSVEFRDCSVIGRETLEDGNFETVTQIL